MASCRRRRPKMSPLSRGCWPSRCEMARRAVVLMNLGGPDSPAAAPPFPTEPGFIAALAGHIDEQLANVARPARLLLSAHGLPLKIVRKGDSYPEQIESTAAAVIDALEHRPEDWRVCYQSRVGPLAWLGPSVDEEIRRAGQGRVGVVIAPISFVSEHSETLVELDRHYRRLAATLGVPFYRRAPTGGH